MTLAAQGINPLGTRHAWVAVLDTGLLLVYIALQEPSGATGFVLHEWIGLAFIPLFIIHIVVSWSLDRNHVESRVERSSAAGADQFPPERDALRDDDRCHRLGTGHLRVRTAGGRRSHAGNPAMGAATQLHELAHHAGGGPAPGAQLELDQARAAALPHAIAAARSHRR